MSELKNVALSQESVDGEWVGEVELEQKRIFIRLEFTSGASETTGSLDLPGTFTFRQKVTAVYLQDGRSDFEVQVHDRTWRFEGQRESHHIHGTCLLADEKGTFSIDRLFDLDPDCYRPYIGDYHLSTDRRVTLGLNSERSWKPPLYFYQEEDHLVRLYPLSATHLLSERGETLLFDTSETDGSGLLWQETSTVQRKIPRSVVYREEEVSLKSGDATLAGTLSMPLHGESFPAVVLVHGSLPNQRDFYRVFASQFVRQGIATLIYDKRGYGSSTGSADATLFDLANDAHAAVTFLQTHQEIDPRRVGLWGFSNGTWVLPIVAARMQDKLAFLIATGATGISMAQAEVYRKICELREWNIADEVLNGVAHAWNIIYEYVATGQWNEQWDNEFEPLIRSLHDNESLQRIPLQQYAIDEPMLSPIPPLISAQQFKETLGGLFPDLAYDPVADYERIRCPVLFVMGELDKNLPVEECVSRVRHALQRGDNQDFTIQTFEQTGHMMNVIHPSIEGMPIEEVSYLLHNFRFAPGFLDLMSKWMMERVKQTT